MLIKVFALIKKLLALTVLSLFAGFGLFKALESIYPVLQPDETKRFSQLVVDKQGRPLRAFADNNGVWRYPTQVNAVAPDYLTALVNYEDRMFWQHHGINPLSMIRAVKQMLFNRRAISGGSTLSMQVARILEPHQKSISGKLWQMFRAYQLEYHFNKNDILNLYLNYAPYGGPIEGVEAASYTYLGKSADQLTTAEAALMAVLPQSPSRLRPDRYAARAQSARDKVLRRMAAFGIWSQDKIDSAKNEPVIASYNSRPMIAPLLSRYLVSKNPQQQILKTNIDIELQIPVADLLKDYLYRFANNTSAAAMIMENDSLNVVAYVGAADFGNLERFGHLDMVRAVRSPGSTLKPFIYGMALDEKLIHSHSLLQDVPLHFAEYSPENFSRSFAGPVSVTKALQQSLNIPAVQVLNHLGSDNFSARIQNAGVQLYFPSGANPSLSLALGGVGVKMHDLVAAYRALAAEGLSGSPRYLQQDVIEQRFLLSPEAAWIIGEILAEVPLEVRQKSPFLKKTKRWVAHKTGTSYGYRDAWMVAVTPTHTLAVWVGKPDGTPSPGEFGRRTAAPLVKRLIALLPEQQMPRKQPTEVTQQVICWPLGKLESLTDKNHCHQQYVASLISDVAPVSLNEDAQVNPISILLNGDSKEQVFAKCFNGNALSQDIALWPIRLEPWLQLQYKRISLLPQVAKICYQNIQIAEELLIFGVENNARIAFGNNIISSEELIKKDSKAQLNFSVSPSNGKFNWLINGKLRSITMSEQIFTLDNLDTGSYKIIVISESGRTGTLNFEVL